ARSPTPTSAAGRTSSSTRVATSPRHGGLLPISCGPRPELPPDDSLCSPSAATIDATCPPCSVVTGWLFGMKAMAMERLGIIMHGATGRMGYNQHLVRSICAIRDQGGVRLGNGDRVMPDPILVGRNSERIADIARKHGIGRTTTDLDAALAAPGDTVFFDAG